MPISNEAKHGTVDLAILAILERQDRYGLEILDEVKRLSGGGLTFKVGSLYPALHRMVRRGLLTARWELSDTGGAPRKYYRITQEGLQQLQHKREEWRRVRDSMEPFLTSAALP